ncbi:MAG: ferredoxin-thioredoxin reductase catalytic domain-containing protein [Methanomassiliicoccales archaeon]|jgi:ferredoxin-thioredoxin reductase catalytic subunit/rubredoxin
MAKKMWRCSVCGDIHYGNRPPETCPTCGAVNVFVLTDFDEVMRIIGDRTDPLDTEEKVIASWRDFVGRNKTVRLTENDDEMKMLCSGVRENLRNRGLRYCPCRIPSGDELKDQALICPCNFTKQKNWSELGECWCGLFKKMEG